MLSFNRTTVSGWNIFTQSLSTANHSSLQFFKRHHHAWGHLNAVRIPDYLNGNGQLATGLQFSSLNPKNVTRPLEELREIYRCIGIDNYYKGEINPNFRNANQIVVFNQERSALHATAALIATEVRVEGDVEFVNICNSLYGFVKNEVSCNHQVFADIENELTEQVHSLATRCKRVSESEDPLEAKFLKIADIIRQRFGTGISEQKIFEVTTKIVFDDLHRDRIKREVYDTAADVIAQEVSAQDVFALPNHSAEERQQVLMFLPHYLKESRVSKVVAGGPGTGKSSVTKQIMAQIKDQYGLSIHDFAFLSTDRFRLVIPNDPSLGKDPKLAGALTQDEAYLMKTYAMELFQDKLQNFEAAPHVFLEVVSPTDAEIELAIGSNSTMHMSVTSYPPVMAVQGTYDRFVSTQERLPPVTAILGGQKFSSQEVPRILKERKNNQIHITIYDTSQLMHQNDSNKAIVSYINVKKNEVNIFSIPGMLEFIKKSFINVKAKNADDVFHAVSDVDLINELISHYSESKLLFINPDAQNVTVDNLHQFTVAEFDKEQGLIIKDQQTYDMMQKDEQNASLFNVLAAMDKKNEKVYERPRIF